MKKFFNLKWLGYENNLLFLFSTIIDKKKNCNNFVNKILLMWYKSGKILIKIKSKYF